MSRLIVNTILFVVLFLSQSILNAVAELFRRFENRMAPSVWYGINGSERTFRSWLSLVFRYGSNRDENTGGYIKLVDGGCL